MYDAILLSLAVAVVCMTVTKSKLFEGMRELISRKSPFFGKLISCSYCLSHWAAILLVLGSGYRTFRVWWPVDLFITWLVIVGVTAPMARLIYWSYAGIPTTKVATK